MTSFVRLSDFDNVVTATKAVTAGVSCEEFNALENIPMGHKIAANNIKKGQQVTKYGQCIGYASVEIKAGEHVHTHNVEFRNTQAEYEFCTDNDAGGFVISDARDSFMGFKRANGSVGTRNYIAIVTSVNCSATAARRIADAFGPSELSEYPNVDGVVAFVHGTGCGMAGDGEGFEALQRVMWGYARHPNHAGVLMVGLGCEMNQIDWLLDAYGLKQGPLFHAMNIQNVAGLAKTIEMGIKKVKEMLPVANQAYREECPVSELKVALQCGGSDAWSGITANPALGKACDILIAQGGTGVLAETPEIYGAEHLLTKRSVNQVTGEKLVNLVKWWEDYTRRNNGSMDNNPSPGNKKGGLTTILEKSLGRSVKGGNTPLMGVYKYADIVKKGGSFLWIAQATTPPQ
jgi:altronate hydrolase